MKSVKSAEESAAPAMDGDKVREGPRAPPSLGNGKGGVGPESPTKGAAASNRKAGERREKCGKTQSPAQDLFCICPKNKKIKMEKSEAKFVLMPRALFTLFFITSFQLFCHVTILQRQQ